MLRKGAAKKDVIMNRHQEGPGKSLYKEGKEIGPKDSILPTGLREKAKMLLEQRETWKHTSLGCLLLLFAWNVLPPDIQMARSFTYFEFF